MSRFVVGIAGTAKNTGKTTTLSAIMRGLKKTVDLKIALTSIGYDGESFDNVTGLPKPRINVWQGDIVAVAENCLPYSFAKVETIMETAIMTPLGKVLIGRVTKAGKIVLAGPNNRRDLRTVLDILAGLDVNLIIVDGALSRIAPMVEVDGLILATGASRFPDIDRLAEESRCIVDLLTLPVLGETERTVYAASILTEAAFASFADHANQADTLCIDGIIGELFVPRLLKSAELFAGKRLIFGDATKLLLAGDVSRVHGTIFALSDRGVQIGLAKPLKLLSITVNPYYPKYRVSSADYEPDYVDADELQKRIQSVISVPCFDVVRQGSDGITSAILDCLK